jgi:hypothetical protein
MITTSKIIKAYQSDLIFSTRDVDPLFFGPAQSTITNIINEINPQLDEERAFMKSMKPTCCGLFWLIIAACLLIPLFFWLCYQVYRRGKYQEHCAKIRNKMLKVVSKYSNELQSHGFMCTVAVDIVMTNVGGKYFADPRFQQNPYFMFTKGGLNNMQPMMNLGHMNQPMIYV